MNLVPVLTPHGVLTLEPAGGQMGDALALPPEQSSHLERAFARGPGHGLLSLGADEVGTALRAILSFWRERGARCVSPVCALPDVAEGREKPPVPIPAEGELEKMASDVPPMTGAEYL